MRLQGKVAILTGLDRDVGAHLARRFVREGARVVASGRTDAGRSVIDELRRDGAEAEWLGGDVSSRGDAEKLVALAVERFGRLDVLVSYNPGRRFVGTIADISDEEIDEEVDNDLRSLVTLSRAALPVMVEGGGGALVNISSIAGAGVKGRALRSAMKAAVNSLTVATALDYGAHNVKVNALLLGPVLTPELQSDSRGRERMEAGAPLRRLPTAQEVAESVVFLASDDSGPMTGVLLRLDSGRALGAPG